MKKRKKSNRNIYLAILLATAIGLIAFYLLKPGIKTETFVQTEAMDIPFRNQGELFFTSGRNGDTLASIEIEVADDVSLRARGLMYRRSLPESAGMLFVQDTEEIQSFWMKNTYIPLDMLFVNGNKEIVTIHANTTPLKEWSYTSTKPALYIVEVNAGFTHRHGIRTGDTIGFNIRQ